MTEQELYSLLQGASAITDITGIDGVHNFYLPDGTNLPAVTLEYVSDKPENTLQGDSGKTRVRYSINVWADSYAKAKQLESAVLLTMSAYYRLSTVPLHDPENNIFRFAIDYSIFR